MNSRRESFRKGQFTARAASSKHGMPIEEFQLLLQIKALLDRENEFPIVISCAFRLSEFFWWCIGIDSKIEAIGFLNAIRMNGTHQMRIVSIQETAIALGNLGHWYRAIEIEGVETFYLSNLITHMPRRCCDRGRSAPCRWVILRWF